MNIIICMITKRISDLRKEKEISQETLANAIGVSQATISRIESGDAYPSLQILAKIARFFHLELRDIVSEGRLNEIFETQGLDAIYAFCPNPFCDSNEFFRNDGEPWIRWKSGKSYPTERYDEINFCSRCGTSLIKECQSCGKPVEESGARFCIRCGEKIVDRPTNDEWEKIRNILDSRGPSVDDIPF